MLTGEIEKVWTVFRGTGARDAHVATKYMNPRKYTQHNPHVADGVDGVKEYISQWPRENHHSKVVRAFQDGSYVFTHEEGLILGQSVFFHIFRSEDGLIVAWRSSVSKSGKARLI
jgi:predicted SnoaL-like aldol condensation-catalyzing enzyme